MFILIPAIENYGTKGDVRSGIWQLFLLPFKDHAPLLTTVTELSSLPPVVGRQTECPSVQTQKGRGGHYLHVREPGQGREEAQREAGGRGAWLQEEGLREPAPCPARGRRQGEK